MAKKKCSLSLGEQIRQARQAAFDVGGAADFYAREAEHHARNGRCAEAEQNLALTWKHVKKAFRSKRRRK